MMDAVRISLSYTAAVLLLMAAIEIVFTTEYGEKRRKTVMNVFVILYGLLLVGLGSSIAAMRPSFQGQGILLTIVALAVAGPFLLVFPARMRAALFAMLEGLGRRYASLLVIADAVLRTALGIAFLYFAWRS